MSAYHKIGAVVTIEGVPCRVVEGDAVPERYLAFLREYQNRPSPTLHCILFRDSREEDWSAYGTAPRALHSPGDWKNTPAWNYKYAVLVPERYLEPEVNEFGKVMP